jgi:methylmalonyl-CoA mutase C-terminal domain/subunit
MSLPQPLSSSNVPTRVRVLVAKPGLDGHNVGLRAVARGLRDAGLEVIYGGMMISPAEIVSIAVQEDVDVIGLSLLSGAHMTLVPEVIRLARDAGLDVLIILGGVVPDDDVVELKRMGLDAFFGPGTTKGEIVSYIESGVAERARREQ